jgi:hypothetical protein
MIGDDVALEMTDRVGEHITLTLRAIKPTHLTQNPDSKNCNCWLQTEKSAFLASQVVDVNLVAKLWAA